MKQMLFSLFVFCFSLLNTPSVFGQQCSDYACVMRRVKKAMADKNYRLAFEQLESARNYSSKNENEISNMLKRIFVAVEQEKTNALNSEKNAIKYKNEAEKKATIASTNQKRAELAEQDSKNNASQLEKQQVSLEKIGRLNRNMNTAIRKEIADPTLALNMMDYIVKHNPNDFSAISKMKDILSDSANIFYSKKIPIKDSILHFAFNEKKRIIIGGSSQGNITMWDFEGNELKTLKTGPSQKITGIEFSPDGSFFYASSFLGWVKTWSPKGELLNTFQIFPIGKNTVASFDLSENGEYFVIGGHKGVVKVFDKSGVEMYSFSENPKEMIWYSSISSDGKTIVYTSIQNNDTLKLRYLDKKAPKYLKIKKSVSSIVTFLKFIEKDSFTVVDFYGELQNYSSKGEISATKGHLKMNDMKVYQKYAGNKAVLTGNDNALKIVLANSESHTLPIYAPQSLINAFVTDSFNKVVACDSKCLYFWDLKNIIERKVKVQNEKISAMALSPDKKLILLGGNDSVVSACDTNGHLRYKLSGHKKGGVRYQFSADNKSILTIDDAGVVRIWTIEGQLIGKLMDDKNPIEGSLFSPDNSSVITFSKDSTLSIWDFKGNILKTIKDSAKINCIAISPKDDNVLIGNYDEKVNSYSLKTGRLNFSKNMGFLASRITFSKDGSYYLINLKDRFNVHYSNGDFKYSERFDNVDNYGADNYGAFINITPSVIVANNGYPGTVGVWDSTGKKTWKMEERRTPITSFHTSDTSGLDMILTSGSNGTVSIYNRKGELVFAQNAHTGSANHAMFTDSKMKILSVGDDGILSIRPNRYALWQSKKFAQYSLGELLANDLELEPEDYEKMNAYEDLIFLANMYSSKANFKAANEMAVKAFNLHKDVKTFSLCLKFSYKLKEALDFKKIGIDTNLLKETLSSLFEKDNIDTLFFLDIGHKPPRTLGSIDNKKYLYLAKNHDFSCFFKRSLILRLILKRFRGTCDCPFNLPTPLFDVLGKKEVESKVKKSD